MTRLLSRHRAADRKREVYEHVAGVVTSGRDKGAGWGKGFWDYDKSGLVYPHKSRRLLKITTGERWYALVAPRDHDLAWLVKRWKLDLVQTIEKLRWRLHQRAARALEKSKALWAEAKQVGRIYHADTLKHYVADKREWQPVDRHDDAVSKLAAIPTEAEVELGERVERADDYHLSCSRTAFMIDEVLAIAFELKSDKPFSQYARDRKPLAFEVNGRRYVCVFVDGHGRIQPERVWPSPNDTTFKL